LKIIGGEAPPTLLELARPGIELTGSVSDLRPHLAAATAVVVPLRLGGGIRLRIVEAIGHGEGHHVDQARSGGDLGYTGARPFDCGAPGGFCAIG
jgi:hypothetical protein